MIDRNPPRDDAAEAISEWMAASIDADLRERRAAKKRARRELKEDEEFGE